MVIKTMVMDITSWLLVITVIEGGIIAGASFDGALVKLPTRNRIGPVAYAQFARGNDLGNGKVVYPLLGVSALLLVLITTVVAWAQHKGADAMEPLFVALAFTLLHTLCTVKAAPIMPSLANTPDEPEVLQQKLARFAFWSRFRAAFQVGAFMVLVWALIAVVRTL